jgi:3-methylcrotonyl-CoA carboxylase beta subunit
MKDNLTQLNAYLHIEAIAKLGGGTDALIKQTEMGKLCARQRIDYLIDQDRDFIEIGAIAAHGMYSEHGGCPSAGVVVVLGHVQGQLCVVVANDASVKAGAWFPATAKKNLRAQEIAMENKIPIIYLVDSAGVFLPLQDEIFPDKEHFGRIFRNNAKLSAMGVVQISAIMGNCVAGGAYLPIMSDEAIIVEDTGTVFLAGSYLVKAAIGENIDNQTLGGADTHCQISGVTDYKAKNDKDALDRIKSHMAKLGQKPTAGFNRVASEAPITSPEEIIKLMPNDRSAAYDTQKIIDALVDAGSFDAYKADYGKTLICGYARIDGWAVGIVANQRMLVKNAQKEMQFGGVIYSDSADKATRFIANCNQRQIPLVFLQDVTGFMVGSRSEHGGIIKDGAKLVNAVANSVVPKFTVVMGNSYGAGNYAMCGKAYDPRLIFSWPWAEMAVMGGQQASTVLSQIREKQLEKAKQQLSEADKQALNQEIKDDYQAKTKAIYAAANLWIDAIVSPTETRKWISIGIAAANHAPITERFNMGVLQV